jgi:hypothetical protein
MTPDTYTEPCHVTAAILEIFTAADPFRPFVIHATDGRRFVVARPEDVGVDGDSGTLAIGGVGVVHVVRVGEVEKLVYWEGNGV